MASFGSVYGKRPEFLTWFLPCSPARWYFPPWITTAPQPVLFCVWKILCVCDEWSQRVLLHPCLFSRGKQVYREQDRLPVTASLLSPRVSLSLSLSHRQFCPLGSQTTHDHLSLFLIEKTGSLHSHFLSLISSASLLSPPSPTHKNKAI
jgi:hypothetical protein